MGFITPLTMGTLGLFDCKKLWNNQCYSQWRHYPLYSNRPFKGRPGKGWKWRPEPNLSQHISQLAAHSDPVPCLCINSSILMTVTSRYLKSMKIVTVNNHVYYDLINSHCQINDHSLINYFLLQVKLIRHLQWFVTCTLAAPWCHRQLTFVFTWLKKLTYYIKLLKVPSSCKFHGVSVWAPCNFLVFSS